MRINAKIINSPHGYKLKKDSLIELFNNLRNVFFKGESQFRYNIVGISDFEHGIKIDFFDSDTYVNDHTLDTEYEWKEKSTLYIFDDGDVVYVHNGSKYTDYEEELDGKLHSKSTWDYTDLSFVTSKLNKKLGREYSTKDPIVTRTNVGQILADIFVNDFMDESNKKKQKLIEEKRNYLLEKIISAVDNKDYTESVFNYNPETNTLEQRPIQELPPLSKVDGNDKKEYFIPDFEWCRKAKYNVQIERACYKIDEDHPLMEGFFEKEFEKDGVIEKYAVKSGKNELEQNSWTTSPDRPFVITGTVGERWPVKPSNISAYDVNEEEITVSPLIVSTKDPSDQEFMIATRIPLGTNIKVVTKWAFKDDGSLDESQVLVSNSENSMVSHANGDYVVAKHIDGVPEYMQLSEEQRNTKEAATLYSPRIINGSVMETTYDHAKTKEEIENKYKKNKTM